MAPPRQTRRGYQPGVVPRATLNLSPDYLRVLEQKALSGQSFLSPEQLMSVTQGGTVEQLPIEAGVAPKADPGPFTRPPIRSAQAQATDLSADTLNSHLGGVLSGKGQYIIDTARKYNVDPRLAAGIIMTESVGGTSHMANQRNNTMGIYDSRAGHYRDFASPEEGVDFGIRNLAKNYIAQGRVTPESIGAKYAPVGASNDPNQTNNQWPSLVRAAIAKLGGKGGNVQQVAATGDTSTSTSQTDTGEGPIYIAPMDRSTLKPITGMGELSTQEELAHAHARAEDWVQELAKAGVQPTQKEYQDHLDAFYGEVHKLNQPVPGQQIVSPAELQRTTPQLISSLPTDAKTGVVQMPSGNQSWSNEQLLSLATYNTNQWVQSLAKQGQKVTQDEYRQEQLNQYNGLAKMNIGLQPTAMSAADAGDLEATYRGYEQLDNLLKLHNVVNNLATKTGTGAAVAAVAGAVPVVGGSLAANIQAGFKNLASPEYKAYDAYRNQILGTMTRGYGGQRGGTLTEQDVQTTKNWLPNEFDSPEQAQTKVLDAQTEGLGVMRDKIAMLKGAHVDTTAAEKMYQDRLAAFQQKTDELRKSSPKLVSSLVDAFYPAPQQATPAQSGASAATEKILAKIQAGVTPAPAPPSGQQDIPAAKITPQSDTASQPTLSPPDLTGVGAYNAPPSTSPPASLPTILEPEYMGIGQDQEPRKYLGGY